MSCSTFNLLLTFNLLQIEMPKRLNAQQGVNVNEPDTAEIAEKMV